MRRPAPVSVLLDVFVLAWHDEAVRLAAGEQVAFLLLVAAACGGRSSRTEPQRCGPRHDLAQAQEAYVRANCALLARCGFYTDASSCIESGDRVPPLFDHAASGCVEVDTGALFRCADELEDADCRLESYFDATQSCLTALRGTLEAGSSCENDFECASRVCEKTACGASCCPGRCAGRNLPVGSTCAADSGCVPDSYCESEVNRCVRLLPVGSPCSAARECEDDLGCHAGTCRRSASEGEPCTTGFFACDVFRDRCDGEVARCMPVGLLGEPCSGRALGGDCVGTAWCDDGTCRPLPSVGEPCVEGRCLGSFVCDPESLRCGPPEEQGDRCP